MEKISFDVIFRDCSRVNVVMDVPRDDVWRFIGVSTITPDDYLYDYYLAYAPELFKYSGEDIKKTTLLNMCVVPF